MSLEEVVGFQSRVTLYRGNISACYEMNLI